jgi:hypothetical protein
MNTILSVLIADQAENIPEDDERMDELEPLPKSKLVTPV